MRSIATSTHGILQVPDNWLPPNHPEFVVEDIVKMTCQLDVAPRSITRKTWIDVSNPRESVNWVEYWLDVGDPELVLIHSSFFTRPQPQPE
jgi:hypothetical protein